MDYSWNIIKEFDESSNWVVSNSGGSVIFSSEKIKFTATSGNSSLIQYDSPLLQKNTKYGIYIGLKELSGLNALKKAIVNIDDSRPKITIHSTAVHFFEMTTGDTPKFEIEFDNQSTESSTIEISSIEVRELNSESYFIRENFFDKYYTKYDKDTDSFKNAFNQGVFERLNILMADELDKQIVPVFSDLVKKLIPSNICDAVYLPLWENQYGNALFSDVDLKRKLINQALSINKIKGSRKSYEILFRYLETDSVFTEEWNYSSFDSLVTFDAANRTFDLSKCNRRCTTYNLDLTYSGSVDNAYITQILSIIRYCEPINAKLKNLTINGDTFFVIQINTDGDLIYSQNMDPTATLYLDENGNLFIDGDNAFRYSIVDGYLIYTL